MSHNEHRENSPSAHASVQDRAGLYIAIVALVLAVLAIGLSVTMPRLIQAEVNAAVERARADMQQQLAKVEATANAGREHARVALDKVEQTQTQLGAKGLIKVETH